MEPYEVSAASADSDSEARLERDLRLYLTSRSVPIEIVPLVS